MTDKSEISVPPFKEKRRRHFATKFVLRNEVRWAAGLELAFCTAEEHLKAPIAFAYWQNNLVFDSCILANSCADQDDPNSAILYVDDSALDPHWREDKAIQLSRIYLHLAFVRCMRAVMHYAGWKGEYSSRWGLFLLPSALVAVTIDNPYERSIAIRSPNATEDDFRRDLDKLQEAFPNTFDLTSLYAAPAPRHESVDSLPRGKIALADIHPFHLSETCTPDSKALFEYWLAKCGSRSMPQRKDIDALDLPARLLPGISIVDVVPDSRRYVYRLVGTMDTQLRGSDPTGKSVRDNFWGPDAQDALGCYDSVVSLAEPIMDPVPMLAGDDFVIDQTIFLPLSENGIDVDKILVFISTRERVSTDHSLTNAWVKSGNSQAMGQSSTNSSMKESHLIEVTSGVDSYPINLATRSLDGESLPIEFLFTTVMSILLVLFATFSADLGFSAFVTETTWVITVLSAVIGFCVAAVAFWINAVDTLHPDNLRSGDFGRMASGFARIFISWMGAIAGFFLCFGAIAYGLVYAIPMATEIAKSMNMTLGLLLAGLVAAIAILGLRHIGETMPHNRKHKR